MLSNITVVVELSEYPQGFALVILASPTDHLCQVRQNFVKTSDHFYPLAFQVQEEENRCPSPLDCSLPSKEVTIRLEENSTYDHYIYVAFGTIVVYAVLFVITIAISYLEFNYVLSSFEELDSIIKEKKVEESFELSKKPLTTE